MKKEEEENISENLNRKNRYEIVKAYFLISEDVILIYHYYII